MLRQILNDMYVDPEILSGLDEYQKQTLFCKMREEQIRRWRVRELEHENQPMSAQQQKRTPNKKNKNVSFREDEEGEPWVLVIEPAIYADSDSDDSDNNLKKPCNEETKQRARELAEIETKELRRQYKAELSEIITNYDNSSNNNSSCNKKDKTISDVCDPLGTPIIDDLEIYCSVDELRERMNQTKLMSTANGISPASKANRIINFSFSATLDNQNERNAILKEISNNKPLQKVSAKIALWEQRVIGEKTNEIYQRLKKKQKEAAEAEAMKQEEAWKEQERKAKEADIVRREISRRAREEHRKSLNSEGESNGLVHNRSIELTNGKHEKQLSTPTPTTPTPNHIFSTKKSPAPQPPKPSPITQQSSSPPSSLDALIPKPSSYEAMIQWYHDVEIGKGAGLESIAESRLPCKWFYGRMSRTDAEQLLESEPMGTFLVRLSEKIWGYAISYKDVDRCKHYLINASTGQYKFLGANQLSHDSLNNLIKHHATVPITAMGKELLIRPCPRGVAVNSTIFDGLF